MLTTDVGLMGFVIAAFASRVLRTLCFWALARPHWVRFGLAEAKDSLRQFATGAWFQYAILAGAVRDNLPILLVAPLFGTQMAGYYIWALQICAASAQFAVAAASRIALPVIAAKKSGAARYDVAIEQIEWLARLLGPILVAIWLVMPVLNTLLFESKWTPALALLPWILVRMMPGIATTVFYPLLFVQFGPRWLAFVSTAWTIIECAAAWLALQVFGPAGLAYSYALAVWPGMMLLAWRIRERPDFSLLSFARLLFGNRPTLVALACGAIIAISGGPRSDMDLVDGAWLIGITGLVVCLAYISSREIRVRLVALVSMARQRMSRPGRIA